MSLPDQKPRATREHMPFAGHRTCKEVREDEERQQRKRSLEVAR